MDGGHQQGHGGMASILAATGVWQHPEMALHLLQQQVSATGGMAAQHGSHAQHMHSIQQAADDDERGASRGGRTRSGDSRSSSAYASRHQQAEARRRTRINERLESLRRLVPHAERANTATFLEEVIKYIQVLQSRNANLERMIRDLQQAPLPGQGPAAAGTDAATAAAAAAASQLLMQQQPNANLPVAGLSMPGVMDSLLGQQQQMPQQQQNLLRPGTAGSSGSLGMTPGLQDTSAQQGFAAAAAAVAGHSALTNSPAAMLMHQQMQQQQPQPESAAQSGAAALLAAAGATAAMAAGAATPAAGAKPFTVTTSSGGAVPGTLSGGRAGAAPANAGEAAAAVDKPLATVQVPDVLQSLLPQGLDLQQMLQQALLSTQAQLLAQLQQHHKQTSSGNGGAAAGVDANTGTAATSSGGTSGQPATSTAPLSALQQALSGQQGPTNHGHHEQQPQQLPVSAAQQQQQMLQASAGLLASPPSLVLPVSSTADDQQAAQQQLLQPAPALEIKGLQQQPLAAGTAGAAAPAANPGLQDAANAANLLAINQIMAQLRANPTAGQLPVATAALLGPVAGLGGVDAAGGASSKPRSPSAAGAPSGGSPAHRAAAAAVGAGATFSGGDGAGSSGAMPSLPNLLALAPPAGVLEQRSSSMSGDRDDDGSTQALKKRKMLVL